MKIPFLKRGTPAKPSAPKAFYAMDEYVKETHSDQAMLDLFRDEWSFSMPAQRLDLKAGTVPAFEDPRVKWAAEQFAGGFNGLQVLELGPLEGAHAYMLQQMGAASIVSVESNKRAFLKCLIVKELFDLNRCRFLLGDAAAYLAAGGPTYNLCFASGILYHMQNPVELLRLISVRAKRIFLWTHYYDAEIIRANDHAARAFGSSSHYDAHGFQCTLHKHLYLEGVLSPAFCGGSAPFSQWMERAAILDCLKHFGFTDLRVGLEQVDHMEGPALCITGRRE